MGNVVNIPQEGSGTVQYKLTLELGSGRHTYIHTHTAQRNSRFMDYIYEVEGRDASKVVRKVGIAEDGRIYVAQNTPDNNGSYYEITDKRLNERIRLVISLQDIERF